MIEASERLKTELEKHIPVCNWGCNLCLALREGIKHIEKLENLLNPIPEEANLRYFRALKGLTQAKLAQRASVSIRTISMIENNPYINTHQDIKRRVLHAIGLDWSDRNRIWRTT